MQDADGQLYVTQLFANPVKLIDTEHIKAKMLEGIHRFRKSRNLAPISHYSITCLNEYVAGKNGYSLKKLLTKSISEIQAMGVVITNAEISSFEGFENPGHDKHLQIISQPGIRAISLALHQDQKTGMFKGVFLFMS